MDSVADVDELVKKAISFGHKAIAITDHGVALAFPFAYKAAKGAENFKIILSFIFCSNENFNSKISSISFTLF